MADRIRATSGPLKGQEFTLVSGLSFGRSKGEIRLDDGKVSSLHAFVAQAPDGSLVLTDNGSKNGIRAGTTKVASLKLVVGTTFGIGNSDFEVISGAPSRPVAPAAPVEETRSTPTVAPSLPTENESSVSGLSAPDIDLSSNLKDVTVARPSTKDKQDFVAPPAPKEKPFEEDKLPATGRKWNDVLAEFAVELSGSIPDQPKAIVPFNPALKFTFIGGLQAETEWTIGYGPRRVGSLSIDLPILEPSAPDVCFELVPSPDGVTFRTNHPKNVRLNGAETKLQALQSGDVIGIGATQIEVEFLK